MPLFRRSEEIPLFLKDPPIFPPFATIWAAKIGKVRSPKYIIQRSSKIKEPTIFMKLIYNFISAKQLLVLPITFFLRVFNKVGLQNNNSEMVPAKSGNWEKVGKFVMGGEVGQGKIKYLKISCFRVLSHREIYNTKTFLNPKIYKLLTNLAPLAYMPSPIHAVLVIITGWHNQPHFTLLPPMQHHRPPSHPLPTTILQGTGVVVLGMQWTWFVENQRSEKRPT